MEAIGVRQKTSEPLFKDIFQYGSDAIVILDDKALLLMRIRQSKC